MKQITMLIVLLISTSLLKAAFGEAIITLKSGEVLHGDIVSDTNDVLQVRAFSSNRSISSLRNIPRADVENVRMETPAQIAERTAYLALSKFQLNPDQEQPTDFYNQWIAQFEKFLNDYPQSDKAVSIQQNIAACKAELKHLANGEVKFANKWMTPEEKKPQTLSRQLASLEQKREALSVAIAAARGRLAGQQSNYQTLPPPAKPQALTEILSSQQKVASDVQTLANLDTKIESAKVQISQAQQAYEVALTKTNQESVQVATAPVPPTPEPIAAPAVAAKPESWIVQNKKLLTIGGGILLILLILVYPVKLLLQKLGHIESRRDEQRRVAREKLKKVFDRIFAEGERPDGDNTPEGDVIPVGKGEDSNGGGRWFVIGEAHIWAVENNGREGDNWAYNNVVTSGHGAVGARIPMDPELADYIRMNASAAK